MDQNMINAMSQAFAGALKEAFPQMGGMPGQKQATSPSGTWIHGPGGLFGGTAIEEQVISLRIAPVGLSQVLRAHPVVETNPEFGYITGIETDPDHSTQPSNECSDCVSGITQTCVQTASFGRVCADTKTLTLRRAVERINRFDVDYSLVNSLFGVQFANDFFRGIARPSNEQVLNLAVAWEMEEVGVMLQNMLMPMTFQGNPANNNGTGYMEFPGLDLQIGTGKVDAYTGDTCPALDSDVKEYNYQLVNATDANGNFLIVRYMEMVEAYLHHNAVRQSLQPVEKVICMRPELFYEFSMIWPLAWLSTRNITLPAGNTNFIDASHVREMVNEIQQSQMIWLNGRRYRVVLDDGIIEYDSTNDANVPAGQFASNIYFLPIRAKNMDVCYYEHLDYRVGRRELVDSRLDDEIWSDDGRFLWTRDKVKFCWKLSGEVRPRVILRTPQLAGRINHVMYSPLQHFRSYDEDSDYFFKGGVSERPSSSLWSDWNLPDRQ